MDDSAAHKVSIVEKSPFTPLPENAQELEADFGNIVLLRRLRAASEIWANSGQYKEFFWLKRIFTLKAHFPENQKRSAIGQPQ